MSLQMTAWLWVAKTTLRKEVPPSLLVPLGAKLVSLIAIASFAHVCESELPGVQPTAKGNIESVNKYNSSSSDFCYSREYVNCELSRLFFFFFFIQVKEAGVLRVIFVNGTVGG